MTEDRLRIERAAEALDFDATDVALFEAVVEHLKAKKNTTQLERAYRTMIRGLLTTRNVDLEKSCWERLARVYHWDMRELDRAITAYEMRVKLGDPPQSVLLAIGDCYEQVGKHAEASAAYEAAALEEPVDADAYNRAFEMHRAGGDVETAFRAAQSLLVLRAPVEEAADMVFQLSPTRLPELRPLDDEAWWKDARAPEEDLFITNVMRFVLPSAKPELPPVETDALMWAARMLGAPQEDDGVFLKPRADFEKVTSNRRLLREEMFVAGREATIFVSPHYGYARASNAELTVAFYAAVKAARPSIVLPSALAPAVDALAESLVRTLSPRTRELLVKAVETFMAEGGRADVAQWQRGIRLTRLRAGVLLAGGVAGIASQLTIDDDELPGPAKRAYAVAFNLGSAHGRLRAKMGWALGAAPPPPATADKEAKKEEQEGEEDTQSGITWVTAHPDGRWIAVGDFEGRVLVWEPAGQRIVGRQELSARVIRVEWTADRERLVAICEGSDELHVFSADGASAVRAIATRHGGVRAMAVHPSKPWAVTTGLDGHVRVWDLEEGTSVVDLTASGEGSACAISEDYVAVGTQSGAFDVWEVATKKGKAGGEVFAGTYVSAMAFSRDGASLVMGGGRGKLVRLDAGGKWTCTKEWKDVPPKPIATNDIRFADDGKRWIAAHSDDRASLFVAPADPSPQSLGQAFWIEKKPWTRDFVVSAACFVPGTKAIVTAHFTDRLRVFVERMPGMFLRVGDVVFDDEAGAPTAFGPIGQAFPVAAPAPPVPAPKEDSVVIGDREHRARSIEEMEFAASLHPCATCGAAPNGLALTGEGDERTLRGDCRFCTTPAAFTFVVEGDPKKMLPRRHELGDERPSTMVEPRALTSELERLTEQGIDDGSRDRALTCIVELLKFPLIRDGERGDALRAERDRLLADVKEPLLATPNAQGEQARYAPGFGAMTRALFSDRVKPNAFAFLEETFGIRIDGLADALQVLPGRPHERTFDGLVTKLVFVLHGSLFSWHREHTPLRDRPLSEWTITMQRGAAEIIDALRRAYGPPRALPAHHIHGEKWSVATRGHAVQLGWYDKLPDWAAPPIDPASRERALVDLARRLSAAQDAGALTQIASWLPLGCGIVPAGAGAASVSLELVPAMKALELCRVLGIRDAFGISREIHGESYEILVPTPGGAPGDGVPPKVGRWRVVIVPEGGPSGGYVPGATPRVGGGPSLFGPEDLVRHVRIEA